MILLVIDQEYEDCKKSCTRKILISFICSDEGKKEKNRENSGEPY